MLKGNCMLINESQLIGSQTAKGGFLNEKDIVNKFNLN